MSNTGERDFDVPPDEEKRLNALHEYGILDTPPEEEFDNLTKLAGRLFEAPIALISLVDEDRLWFKSNHGIDFREVQREASMCNAVVLRKETVSIPDTNQDPCAQANSLTTDKGIRSYLGAPIIGPGNHVLGTFCVLDTRSREFSDGDVEQIQTLANEVMSRFKHIKKNQRLNYYKNRLQLTLNAADAGCWELDLNTDDVVWDRFRQRMSGLKPGEFSGTWEGMLDEIPPDDQPEVRDRLEDAAESGKQFQIDHRIQRPELENTRWVQIRGQHNADGDLLRGIAVDITGRKQTERNLKIALQQQKTLMEEAHHRIKNNLQIISSILHLQARNMEDSEIKEKLLDSRNRLQSISMIHDKLYRSDKLDRVRIREYFQDLFESLVSALSSPDEDYDIELDVETELTLETRTAVSCGLIINELITNTLENTTPQPSDQPDLSLSVKTDGDRNVTMTYSDNGPGLPEDFDLGTDPSLGLKLVKRLSEEQLGGTFELDGENGLTFGTTFPTEAA